jgi:DNA-binding transcriptional LysR family regulator
METRELRYFVAVAEELHFGRAAERLHMTQPPLSRQIQKLERAVAARLLERDNRNVELTPAGTVFLDEARRLLAQADGALEHTRRVEAGSAGTVRIGFTAASAFGVLTRVLDHLGTTCPDIHLDLFEMVSREQIAGLLAGELDLGLARPPFDTTAFASRLLHSVGLLLAVPSGHRLAGPGATPADVADVAGEPVILYSSGEARYFYDLVVRLVPGADANVVHRVSQVVTMVSLVAGGRGIAFVPASAARLGIPGVSLVPLAGLPPAPVELHTLWLREVRNPALRSVLDHLPSALGQPPEESADAEAGGRALPPGG